MIRLLGVPFLPAGLLLLAAGGRGWAETRAREARVQRVEGAVVRLDEDPSPRVRAYHAMVEARGADGSRVEVRQLRGSDPPAHRVGERVPLPVDPRDPGESRLASEGGARWRPVRIQLALATAFLWMGAVAVRLGGTRIPGGRPARWRGAAAPRTGRSGTPAERGEDRVLPRAPPHPQRPAARHRPRSTWRSIATPTARRRSARAATAAVSP